MEANSLAELFNASKNLKLISQLEVANTFWSRGRGLLGRSFLSENQGLWIHSSGSIHTCFMKFPIDCIFLDKNLKVKSLNKTIKPWRLALSPWGASSVIELSAGQIDRLKIELGDQLYVVS